MATVSALNNNLRGTDRSPARVSDDTRHNDQLPNKVALQISQHAGVLVTVDLDLEERCILKLISRLIVGLVHLLDGSLELNNISFLVLTKGR